MSGFTGIRQRRPNELVDILRADFQHRNEPNFAWKSAVSAFLALPGLRGFWPMSSVDYNSTYRARDLSGQGYHLTDIGTVTFGYDDLAPYAAFNGQNILFRADGGAGNWADIIGTESYIVNGQRGLTIGGWFYPTSTADSQAFMSKYTLAAGQRSYTLYVRSTGNRHFTVSDDGTNNIFSPSGGAPVADTWQFLVGRFVPSASVDIYVDNVKYSTVAGVPASIFDSTTDFYIGAFVGPSYKYSGRASMCFLCASALSDAIIGQLFQWTRKMYGV